MYSVIIDDPTEESSKKKNIKVNFGKVYLVLLFLSVALIYFYSVRQDNYLSILIPYRILWAISILFSGISILRVKNTAAFSLGFFITTLSVGITIAYTFVYSYNIIDNSDNYIFNTDKASAISTDINFITTTAKIKSEGDNFFRVDSASNYDQIISNNYRDENRIENIQLNYNLLPPGIGSYKKDLDIFLPNNIPIVLKINSNLSFIEADISNIKLKSSYINAKNSTVDIVIKDIDIEEDIVLDIRANLSRFNIVISKEIPLVVSNSSSLSQIEFLGISKDPRSSNNYITITEDNETYNTEENKQSPEISKKVIINLSSTLSQIKITQK